MEYVYSYFIYGSKDALLGGFLLISIRLLFCNNLKDTFQTFGKWACIYCSTGLLMAFIALMAIIRIYRVPYYTELALLVAVPALFLFFIINRSAKTAQLITSNVLLYILVAVQGMHVIEVISSLFAITSAVSAGMMLGCISSFLFGFIFFSMLIAVVLSRISQSFPKSKIILLTLLVLLYIGKGLLRLTDIYMY